MKHDFEAELTSEDEEASKEQYWEDEYEDKEGENTAATVEDKYLEVKTFRCQKCGRAARQRATFLFKPMCCGHQMKPKEETEKKTGFKQLVKKAAEKTKKALKKPVKAKKAAKKTKAKPKKALKKVRKPKSKPSKAKKSKKTKAGKKRRR